MQRLQFKQQQFQQEAAQAVVDVFAGQPKLTDTFALEQMGSTIANAALTLTPAQLLAHINARQSQAGLELTHDPDDVYNLSIEMETGVGKTYTYIKTIHELCSHYGWRKFIVVVPSIAVREGVLKSFESTRQHFMELYPEQRLHAFVYNSEQTADIAAFASSLDIEVMVINVQAFNVALDVAEIEAQEQSWAQGQVVVGARIKSSELRRMFRRLDSLQSQRMIDVLAQTHPIVIIDEPQSVEGASQSVHARHNLKFFNPLFTLRYSATHRKGDEHNMLFKLDAIDAYNQQLVKKITVKGITVSGNKASSSYVYLERIMLDSQTEPVAVVHFNLLNAKNSQNPIRRVVRQLRAGADLFALSNGIEEYRDRFVITTIDGANDCIELLNGIKLKVGEAMGAVEEDALRRIQIRETILSHFEREQALFAQNIKVLSLFFIDEVKLYREYDEDGNALNGRYAQMFEEEYEQLKQETVARCKAELSPLAQQAELYAGAGAFAAYSEHDQALLKYIAYLEAIAVGKTHSGYFSIDKSNKLTDPKAKRGQSTDDVSAYDLIMRSKELLLDLDPVRSPVRFIFSHSALREGWDNPNVFQICTLKQSASDIRKRQEVGRGLRLCVNNFGVRQDRSVLGEQVHDINVLTVIASESYENFAQGLQQELVAELSGQTALDADFFQDKKLYDANGNIYTINNHEAKKLSAHLVKHGYVDAKGQLTERGRNAVALDELELPKSLSQLQPFVGALTQLLKTQRPRPMVPPDMVTNSRKQRRLQPKSEIIHSREFKELWQRISPKSVYSVDFDSKELIRDAISNIDCHLQVSELMYTVESGSMATDTKRQELEQGQAFELECSKVLTEHQLQRAQPLASATQLTKSAVSNTPYDLIGRLVELTNLTRRTIVAILQGIRSDKFELFKRNPEEFIAKVAQLINEAKSQTIVAHISYNRIEERYDQSIFYDNSPSLSNILTTAKKHLYSEGVACDSQVEQKLVHELESSEHVCFYIKLPKVFSIRTPLGNYSPDWAIVFKEDNGVKHCYFVAETKGSLSSLNLRPVEQGKIICAKKHFAALGHDIKYDAITNFDQLIRLVKF